VPASATLHEAARILAEREISCLVVLGDDGPVGIVSERDLVRYVAGNPEACGNRRVDEVMSHPLHTVTPGDTVAQAIGALSRHHIRRLPVVTPAGELAGILTQTDLLRATERRLAAYAADLERLVSERTAELRDLERRRDDLVDLTVHDIKNSVSVVDSVLRMMDDELTEPAVVMPLLRRATVRISMLVCTLLDVNRLENGSMALRVQEVPWTTLCDPLLSELDLVARNRSITFDRTGERHVIVRCDPTLVERILLNLLDNALTAAPEGTKVDVHAERATGGGFLVRVGNRGRTIPPDALPTLFDKYRQAGETSLLKRYGGWGLGLTFCRLAVERHGGTIRAISPYADGEGAAFEFVIPADPR